MKIYNESAIRKQADTPTIQMLDLWHSLCEERINYSIEVMVADRKEHHQLGSFKGELYTSYPHIIEGKLRLVLWLDSLDNVNPIIITHELGHRVLDLQGYKGLLDTINRHSDTEIMLNSLSDHPPLYVLQRSLGHEPQSEIDSRTQHNIDVYSRDKEKGKQNWMRNALLLADDLTNCSEQYRKKLRSIVKARHPNTSKLLRKVLTIMQSYNLLKCDSNLRFRQRTITDLHLGSNWKEADNISQYISQSKEANQQLPATGI